MTKRRFSQEYKTYGSWLKGQSRDSRYAKRIIRFHERFPNLPLKELRNVRIKDHDLSSIPWKELSSQQKRDRNLSLEILRSLRKNNSLKQVSQKLGISKDFAVKHLGKNLIKSGGKWTARASDNIQTEMMIYEKNKGIRTIITACSKDRSLIAKYFTSVQKTLKNNDKTFLKEFKDLKIVDANGTEHEFETDLENLYEIQDAIEEPEFLEIYQH
jgi:hypothetical protein